MLQHHSPEAPRTGKQTIRTRIHSTTFVLASTVPYRIHKIYTSKTVEWKTVTGNPRVTRKFANMCCTCNTSPKLALRTSATTSHVTCLLSISKSSRADALCHPDSRRGCCRSSTCLCSLMALLQQRSPQRL